jgi:uncharacterized protein (DUF362 family)
MNRKVAIVRCESYDPEEIYEALRKAFDLLDLESVEEFSDNDFILKPNLCLPAVPEAHLTTHPEVIRQLIKLLKARNNTLRIGDTSIGYDDNRRSDLVWEKTGFKKLLEEFDISQADLQKDICFNEVKINGEDFILPIAREITQSNVINVPKLKTHSYMLMTACVKNFYGVLAGDAKKRFHHLIGTKEKFVKLLLTINSLVNNRLNVVDAIDCIEGEGPGAKGEIRHLGLLVVGFDTVMTDKVLARLMGLESDDVLTNKYATDVEPVVLGEKIEDVCKEFVLPVVNPKSDTIIEHVIEAKSHKAFIDEDKCKKCGLCFRNCPATAIKNEEGKYAINDKKCISCFVCIEVCPFAAIMVKGSGIYKYIKNGEQQSNSAGVDDSKK